MLTDVDICLELVIKLFYGGLFFMSSLKNINTFFFPFNVPHILMCLLLGENLYFGPGGFVPDHVHRKLMAEQ